MQSGIRTRRLVLRRAQEADLEPYCRRIYGDPAVMRTLPGGQPLALDAALARARSNLVEHWERHGFGPWIVQSAGDGRLLGHCGLRRWPGTEDVEVLYALEHPAWGNGYATEGARASVAHGFTALALERIVAGVLPGNAASTAVIRNLGMREWEERDLEGLHVRMYAIDRARWAAP